MIRVIDAPPFATIQDLGRTGFRSSGVPISGVADRDTALALNALLGNDDNAAMIEWAVAGGKLGFDGDATIAFGGARCDVKLNDTPISPLTAIDVGAGDELNVGHFILGRFLNIAVRGGIDVPLVMGSRSTLLSAGIGGFHGRRLRSGDELHVATDVRHASTQRSTSVDTLAQAPIRITAGPQASLFDDSAWHALLSAELRISRASDRTGYRIDGVELAHTGSDALPSEPGCVGAVQIPGGGSPIVIMHDGPTIGGYPRIAVICSADLSRFAQLAPGDALRFEVVSQAAAM
jgi:biotin-dependent carboxylase-like uncharacterized protein